MTTYATIESTHAKVKDKFDTARHGYEALPAIISALATLPKHIPNINIRIDEIETSYEDYSLDIIDVLARYHSGEISEATATREYYRALAAGNHVATADRYIGRLITTCTQIRAAASASQHATIDKILRDAKSAASIAISSIVEKKAYEICKCGSRMDVRPEHSELECPQCGRLKELQGTVFRDEQFYACEGTKTKHGGYDPSRHYKFHIERLQALENKTFDDAILTKIEQVIHDDKYDRRLLDCERMRNILRDPRVSITGKSVAGRASSIIKGTKLNDHAPLLVKMCGGPSPPLLSFKENQLASLRFSKIMVLYDQVVPEGGNKPYYPYFIFKIIEHMFRNDPTKLRLIDYIHLQSRDTVIKHDKIYEQICELAHESDGLVYTPTNRSQRTRVT